MFWHRVWSSFRLLLVLSRAVVVVAPEWPAFGDAKYQFHTIVGRAQRLGGYGNYVEVEHGNAIQTRYGHMSSYVVIPGQSIKKGDVLGYVGSTGRSTGNHLHYEVRIEGAPVNPMPFVRSDQMAIAAITGKNVAMGGPE